MQWKTCSKICHPNMATRWVDLASFLRDGPLEAMTVPWALRGALIHNLVIALNLVPLLHKEVSLKLRAELGVSGFVALDVLFYVGFPDGSEDESTYWIMFHGWADQRQPTGCMSLGGAGDGEQGGDLLPLDPRVRETVRNLHRGRTSPCCDVSRRTAN